MPDQPHSTPTSELPRSPRVTSVPVPVGDGAPALSQPGAQTDPTPASSALAVDAARSAPQGQRDAAGAGRPNRDDRGRFLAKPRIPAMSAALAQALLDADAEAFRVETALRTNRVLAAAVGFVDGVRHSGEEAP